MTKQAVTIILLTTALFNRVVEDAPSVFSNVKHVLFGGEAADYRSVQRFLDLSNRPRLLHLYGPTENTTFSTWYEVHQISNNVPIGKPVSNSSVYVLDPQLNPVPIGIIGELCLAGDGLARGYLNRPELNAQRFVTNPNPGCDGVRIYRTGDLARYRSDGNIEFVGRIDQQVKIRGYRIELGEIENIILQQDSIKECVVITRDDPSGEKQLVAYVVVDSYATSEMALQQLNEEGNVFDQPTETDEDLLTSNTNDWKCTLTDEDIPADEMICGTAHHKFVPSLRDKLSTVLPKFMVPRSIVAMNSLPLTPNGKIDRRALPAPTSYHTEDDKNYVAPRTELEKTLTNIFSEVLGIERVSIYGNFFDLGGHSLSATKVMSRIRVALGREVPLKLLFEAPTAASLSERIPPVDGVVGSTQNGIPEMKRLTQRNYLPLSFAQERLWFMNELIPNSPFYNVAFALTISSDLKVNALKQSILDVIWRHEALRTIFVLSGNDPVQVIKPASFFTLAFIEYCEISDDLNLLKSIVINEARKPFDLTEGPLIRVKLIRQSSGEYVLSIVLHHIISDGWSITVLQKELAALYESHSLGTPSPLPELGIQYADFAVWQREWLQGEILDQQLGYWKNQLDGISTLNLPIDFVRPSALSYSAKVAELNLKPSFTQLLNELSKNEASTLFMTLLTAFEILVCKYTGQNDIAVGSPIANRGSATNIQRTSGTREGGYFGCL
ncbi:hypothetical protein K7432_017083 [Basidiobolus ranarum]|uniref:Carrier domain-containing protein n=1 Tax=Basidiobolus ranarum TaxID=34480 RepID=A0ABR2VKT5_9FUNG